MLLCDVTNKQTNDGVVLKTFWAPKTLGSIGSRHSPRATPMLTGKQHRKSPMHHRQPAPMPMQQTDAIFLFRKYSWRTDVTHFRSSTFLDAINHYWTINHHHWTIINRHRHWSNLGRLVDDIDNVLFINRHLH